MNRDRDRVERALREPGPREERSGFVALPADIAEARAMLRHSERSRILRGFLGAGAAVATAAVAVLVALAVTQAPAPAANGVGSASSSPSPTPSPPPVAGCRAGDFAWSSGPWGGGAGSRGTIVVARGVGSLQGCIIRGRATLTLRDANGTLLVTGHTALNDVRLTAGMQFEVGVTWSNWCGAEPAQPMSLQLILPGDSTPVPLVPANDHGLTFQTCNGPGQPSTLGGTNFQLSSRPPIQG